MGRIKRGEIWLADARPGSAALAGKIRPVLVLQNDAMNQSDIPTVIAAPLTTQDHPTKFYLRVFLHAGEKLLKSSEVMLDQATTYEKRKLIKGPLRTLSDLEMAAVNRVLATVLGLV